MVQPTIDYAPETCGNCYGTGCNACGNVGSVLVAQPARKCGNCYGTGCNACGNTGWAHALKP